MALVEYIIHTYQLIVGLALRVRFVDKMYIQNRHPYPLK